MSEKQEAGLECAGDEVFVAGYMWLLLGKLHKWNCMQQLLIHVQLQKSIVVREVCHSNCVGVWFHFLSIARSTVLHRMYWHLNQVDSAKYTGVNSVRMPAVECTSN